MEKIGRYNIVRLIGRGGLGSVYLAEDTAIGRQVAVKVIPLRGPDSDYQMKRIEREVAILGQLNHPNIIKIYDVGQAGDDAFIVMEYIDGADLSHLMRDGRITGKLAATILEEVAAALDYAHGRGVIHRDVKPSNILVSKDERVLLTDFGVARIQKSERTTATRTIVGTVSYMSPEQIEAKEPTAAADQFSLGVVVYQLLTGAMPFEADSIGSTLEGVLRRTPQPPDILNPSLGAQASVVILKALEKDPNQRYASCTEFVSRLLEATSRLSGWNLPQTPTKRSDRERTKSPLVEAPPVAAVPSPVPAEATAISRLQQLEAPDDFVTQKSTFFRASRARFESIEDSIRFYRENLNSDYQRLAKQADLAYKLWLGCVAVGFIVLAIGVVMMLTTDVKRGAVTSASTVLVYFIQRVFQQREDHYRTAADEKSSHLEYGNQWLLVIQSLDGIQNDEERIKRQARLVDVLTQKLEQKSKALEKGRSQGPKKKTRGDVGSASIH